MSEGRIAARFAACRAERRAALVGYLTVGDPDYAGSLERATAACEAGLDILELGVPFSDPTADGPEIQAAMVRALASGTKLAHALELTHELRARFTELPIVLFGYANPLLRAAGRDDQGLAGLCRTLVDAGVDGLLVVDLPPEEQQLRGAARAAGHDWIARCAPTSPPARRDRIVAAASGFVYAVSLTGVTGAALDAGAAALHEQLADLRQRTALPIAGGFGVREREQVAALAPRVDAVVVGSAFVRAGRQGSEALAAKVRELRAGLVRGSVGGTLD